MACRPVRVQTGECKDLIWIGWIYDGCAPYLLLYRFPDLVPVHIPFDDHFMFYRTTIMALVSPLFLASVASLTLAMTTIDATIKLLQQMKILPTTGTCSSCYSSSGSYKTEGLYHYFRCTTCKKKQSLLHNTVLSNSNTLLHDFVLLMYQFWNSHRTYNTVIKETFLPQEGYKEKHLSRKTINKWFSYFRLLCMRAQKSSTTKIGGEGDVVESDESMSHRSGKC